jgi:hypothetical protein
VDASYSKSFLKTKIHLSSGQSISVRLNPDVFSVGRLPLLRRRGRHENPGWSRIFLAAAQL